MSINDATTHHGLISNLHRNGLIKTPLLVNAFLKVDRKYFNPHPQPYEDHPYTIGANATISAPNVHTVGAEALMENIITTVTMTTTNPTTNQQETINAVPCRSILDVASGSGAQTALFGTIIQLLQQQYPENDNLTHSKVYGIDIHPSLVTQSIENVNNCNPSLISSGLVELYRADAFRPPTRFKGAPFDVIHSGVAIQFVPLALLTQLKPGGAMISPIQVNAQTNDQNFYHLVRRGIDEIDVNNLPKDSEYYNDIKNDDDLFTYGLNLQNNGSPQEINKFLHTFFTYKSLFSCIYLMALDDQTVASHIPAFKVNNGKNGD